MARILIFLDEDECPRHIGYLADDLGVHQVAQAYEGDLLKVIEAAKRIQESPASEQESRGVNEDCVLILVHMTYLDEVQARMKQWAEIDDLDAVHYLWGHVVHEHVIE
jgi:hypothetical protein